MKVSLNLIKEYVDLDGLSAKEITDALSLSGFELDGIETLAEASNLVIGEVLSCENHPDSDHLHVTNTSIGKETLQIVCGAPNCRKGLKVIVALPGAILPAKGITIQKGQIRGVESNGMLCSLLELGVKEDNLTDYQKQGIEELPKDAEVGKTNVLEYLGLDDTILDISVTPNRADVLGLYKFFIEVSAILNRPMKKELFKELKLNEESKFKCSSLTNNCKFFSVREIKGITIKESPAWMQNILKAHDIKVINNIVDIGNYVTLMTGQPLHMYDEDSLIGNELIVRDDLNEEVVALDEKIYHLENGDLAVTNNAHCACIAGVIGSNTTKILDNTKNIVLEAALFDGQTILNSAKKFNIMTVAATNYSKNAVDKYSVIKASDLACLLLNEYADAKIITKPYIYNALDLKEIKIDITLNEINRRLAINASMDEIKDIFNRLKFNCDYKNDLITVHVPTYRNDMSIKEDVLEEVIRLYGYDKVPFTLANVKTENVGLTLLQKQKRIIDNYLLDLGINNTLSYTLMPLEDVKYYAFLDKDEPITLPHPLTEQKSTLRLNMIGSMLKTIFYNQARNSEDVAIYEISKVYSSNNINGTTKLAIAISNNFQVEKWLGGNKCDFYTMKGIMEGLLTLFGIDSNRYTFEPLKNTINDQIIFHPGASATLKIQGKVVGYLGMIHPTTLKREGIDKTVYCELNLDEFLNIKTSKIKYTPVSKFPTVKRDLAIILKDDIDASTILRTIKKAGGSLLIDASIFDIYQGEHIEKGYRSVAISLSFNDFTKTLDEVTINDTFNKIYEALVSQLKARMR